ncbi:MAG: hypothetical protein HPY90_05585 [Syntrophothermus sp.]|uniref:type II secretion system F family protein n=1 Tax=Syntrophothermus sp. TaxID=2736299 RepID=UPI00257FB678|nr:hypothetical protein [Syntrophothermus sp.]NSW82736.1 hypothetical protein [Syntrophothermus sp.]
MTLVLAAGLLVSLFMLSYYLLVPTETSVGPLVKSADYVRYRLSEYLERQANQTALEVLKKTTNEVLKTGLVVGGGLALLALVIGLKLIGWLAVSLAAALFFAGVFITDLVLKNEYRTWQEKLLEGIPVLVSFMPSFLETGSITPREALQLTTQFLPEPLRSEMDKVMAKINFKADVKGAFYELSRRARHPLVDAISYRIHTAWDTRVNADIFDDLNDQIADMHELAATRATAAKSGLFALVCVLGLLGAVLVFGYPGMQYLFSQLGSVFGGM